MQILGSRPSACKWGPSRRPWLSIACPGEQGHVLFGTAWGRGREHVLMALAITSVSSVREEVSVGPSPVLCASPWPLGRCDRSASSGRKFPTALRFWSLGSSMDGWPEYLCGRGANCQLGDMTAAICLKVTSFTAHVLGFCMHAPEVTLLQSGPRVPSVWPWDHVTRGNLVSPSRWPCGCLQPLPPIVRGPSSWSSFTGPLCGPVTTGPPCDLLPEPPSPVLQLPGAAPGPCWKRPEE